MPSYSFSCVKCGHIFDELCLWEEIAKTQCQKCKSKKLNRIFGAPNIVFADPRGTSKFDNFGYRAGYNMEKAKNDRRTAENASHMGADPYQKIDDLNIGNYFGKVK